jgi:chloramphenicol 3-O-phosphotransferase
MEAIQIAASLLKLAHPLFGFCDHHVTVKCPLSVGGSRSVDVAADFRNDWGAKGHVRHKVAVHDVDLDTSAMSRAQFQSLQAYM